MAFDRCFESWNLAVSKGTLWREPEFGPATALVVPLSQDHCHGACQSRHADFPFIDTRIFAFQAQLIGESARKIDILKLTRLCEATTGAGKNGDDLCIYSHYKCHS
jgi:hypothetical protein